ncbi:MAG: hypothetical protein LQ340_002085 [Diploschistes diacapsis]|nr:MAG: hypothetical protein LQ340_002085 [Diploschistes diacapsis]
MVHPTSSPLLFPTSPCSMLILLIALGTFLQLAIVGAALLWARERQRRLTLEISVTDTETGWEEKKGLLKWGERGSMEKGVEVRVLEGKRG